MASEIDLSSLNRALEALPEKFKGPGGVAGVVADGKVLARQAWGYADMASGQAMTTATRLPICSISKQFTCGVLLDLVGDPARLDARVVDFLPRLEGRMPTVANFFRFAASYMSASQGFGRLQHTRPARGGKRAQWR